MRLYIVYKHSGGNLAFPRDSGLTTHTCALVGLRPQYGAWLVSGTKAEITAIKAFVDPDLLWLLPLQPAGIAITDAQGRRGITVANVEMDDAISAADRTRINTWAANHGLGATVPAGAKYSVVLATILRKFDPDWTPKRQWVRDPEEA